MNLVEKSPFIQFRMRESQKNEAQGAYAQLWLRDAFPVDGTTMGYVCFSLFKSSRLQLNIPVFLGRGLTSYFPKEESVPFASSHKNGLSAEFGSSTESRSTLSWRTKRRHSSPARCKLDFQELTQDRPRLKCGRLENVRLVTCRSRGSNPSPATTF